MRLEHKDFRDTGGANSVRGCAKKCHSKASNRNSRIEHFNSGLIFSVRYRTNESLSHETGAFQQGLRQGATNLK